MSHQDRREFLTTAGKTVVAAGLAATALAAGQPLAPPDKQPPNLTLPTPPHKRVGYAIVGLGELALEEILPAFAVSADSAPVALVSGHRGKAEKVPAHYGIDPRNLYDYQTYDQLRDNPPSTPSTSCCPTACTASTPSGPSPPASTCSARSPWPPPWPTARP